jgi:hypothetical protein
MRFAVSYLVGNNYNSTPNDRAQILSQLVQDLKIRNLNLGQIADMFVCARQFSWLVVERRRIWNCQSFPMSIMRLSLLLTRLQ